MADFGGADLDAFRAQACAWLDENFPKSLAADTDGQQLAAQSPQAPTGDFAVWKQRMAEKGWGAPTWPSQYGGGGLSAAEARVLADEMNRIGAVNPIAGMGISMFGPTLLEYGDEAQKQRHIPPIVRGEIRWCQGFSEPGAGSDLASLQTKAVDAGDHYIVSGQKIWTSGAQYADWCFCLVRTDTTRKHEGISFLLIDMKSPGVEVRPIRLIAGNSPFCETFFTEVKVPKENLVGPLNGGWTIGKRLLQFERNGMGNRQNGPAPAAVHEIAKRYVATDASGRLADRDLRSRIVQHEMETKLVQLTARRIAVEAKGNQGPSAATSIMKNASMKAGQERQELLVEIMGSQGLGWEGEGFTQDELGAMRAMLSTKAFTIFGGSTEIQNNIISKRILGLPETTQSR
ncbi:acyl-CoA dehydrogenase family protein [Phenylobacterium sp.]|uniref:acyl-CoA dehydrogenase family protein n=1 Tax=Phenylobacterium sp. TaxID=1871053 RepID=UPI0035B2D2D4